MAARTGNTYISGTMIDSIEIPTVIWGFRPCLAEIKYFRFRRPYCYFRLSVVLAVTFFELALVENSKVQLKTNKFVVLLLKERIRGVSRNALYKSTLLT